MKTNLKLLVVALLIIPAFVQSLGQNSITVQTETLTIDEVLAQLPALNGQRISVQGKCSHVCQESGKKLFLQSKDGQKTLRFNAAASIGKFDPKAKGNIVRISGTVKETRMTSADIDSLEQKIKASLLTQNITAPKEHCNSEAKANEEKPTNSELERVVALREKLNKRIAEENKNYLSFFVVENSDAATFINQ